MKITSGKMIHIGEQSAIKFSENKLEDIYTNIEKFTEEENKQAKDLLNVNIS